MTSRTLVDPSSSSPTADRIADERQRLVTLRHELLHHPLYAAVRDVAALRHFLQQHVFAVWDFMSLLKRLQREVTCVEVPWQPRPAADSCRFVTEILLAEECDEDGRGGYASHFEMYLAAMRDVGADTGPIERFLQRLQAGISLETALIDDGILPATREFVMFTIQLAQRGTPAAVAAAFFHGREDVIPEMFSRMVSQLEREGLPIDRFLHYLRRHIEVDGDQHGPLADRLLRQLCGSDPALELLAMHAATDALHHRIQLWDGILSTLPR